MDQYRTSGVIDEAAIKETAKIFIPSWYRRLTGTFCILSFLMALFLGFGVKKIGFACFFLLFTALFASYPALHRRRSGKITAARLAEQAGSCSLRIESFFNMDGLVVHNLNTDGSILLRYDSIAFLSQSKHYFAVMTKGQQFSILFKDCLLPEQIESFVPFLKEKCPKLKIRR